MFFQDDWIHSLPVFALSLINQNFHRHLVIVSFSCHVFNFDFLVFINRAQTFGWHVCDVEVKLYEIVSVESCEVCFWYFITISVRVLQVTADVNSRDKEAFIDAINVDLDFVLILFFVITNDDSSEALNFASQSDETASPYFFVFFAMRDLFIVFVVVAAQVEPISRLRAV